MAIGPLIYQLLFGPKRRRGRSVGAAGMDELEDLEDEEEDDEEEEGG